MDNLEIKLSVVDKQDSKIDSQLRYCITIIDNNNCETQSYIRLADISDSGVATISYSLRSEDLINYKNFKLIVLPIKDEIGNANNVYTITNLATKKITKQIRGMPYLVAWRQTVSD